MPQKVFWGQMLCWIPRTSPCFAGGTLTLSVPPCYRAKPESILEWYLSHLLIAGISNTYTLQEETFISAHSYGTQSTVDFKAKNGMVESRGKMLTSQEAEREGQDLETKIHHWPHLQ